MNNLAHARAVFKAKLESGEVTRSDRLDPMQKAQQNPESLRKAVNAACYDCVGGSHTLNWREEVRNCPLQQKCPLWNVRQYK